ncbi:FAD-dependent oxidoreductase [bacterium]|nr:FAD-dependent oxidoreductase [bacterium]
MPLKRLVSAACGCLSLLCAGEVTAAVVRESARRIPVVHDVDVVVVGGTSGGVAAAVAAAEAGATVFVAAPRPYLGEDMCATYRLWLEPGEVPESPLAKAVFADPTAERGLSFTYQADQPSAGKHVDSDPPSILADGQWDNAFTQSVQYDADVNVTLDLGEPRGLSRIRFMLFQSPRNFEVAGVTVSVSNDGAAWRRVAVVPNGKLGQAGYVERSFELEAPVAARARYVRGFFRRAPGAKRMLLGEILVMPAKGERQERPGLAMATPMQVKQTLDQALLDAGVPFLYGCYATDVLRDEAGRIAGIVMANRAGRQAVKAKVVVDATDRAWLARMTAARFAPYPAGPQTFRRIVVGGAALQGAGMTSRLIPLRRKLGGKAPIAYGTGSWATKTNRTMATEVGELIEYVLTIPMKDGAWPSFAAAEQAARDRTFHPEQMDESEVLFQVPPDPMRGVGRLTGAWPGAASASLDWFRPAGVEGVFVLGGCADVPRAAAAKLLRPLEQMAMGRLIGVAAAKLAKATPTLSGVALKGQAPAPAAAAGDTHEFLTGLRPTQRGLPTVPAEARSLPVFGRYDVAVVGGGTAGAPAAIGAARSGARTLVVEYLHGLGGVGTTGLIGIYCAGYRKGFTAETEAAIAKIGAPCYVVGKLEWWRTASRRAGADIWFGALGAGTFVDQGTVKGAIVVTPQGRGVVLARTVVDGTGHADVAAAAGAPCMYTGGDHIAIQGAGLPRWELGATYINTDWTYVDESDMLDVWSAFVVAKQMNKTAYDLGQLIDTRERRRIVGDHVLSPLDIVNRRTFADTVAISSGGRLDKHGLTIHPYFMIRNWKGGTAYTPYRCLLPKGLDGILVVGLGLSAHCDAIPSIRMQPCMQNLGYAAGLAAAMAARLDGRTRDIDIKALQKRLVAAQCLTPDVPRHTDSFPIPEAKVRAAVTTLAEKDYSGLGVLLAQPDLSLPMMRAALAAGATSADGRRRCAHVLAMMGNPAGVPILIEAVDGFKELDTESIDRYFPWATWLDSYLIALGRSRDPRALRPLLAKLALLERGTSHRGSHYRALALALEALGDPRAAGPLARVMKKTRLDAATVTRLEPTKRTRRGKSGATELALARALYRLGDHEGIGEKVLRAYARDLRGHFARHAQAVLDAGKGPTQSPRP